MLHMQLYCYTINLKYIYFGEGGLYMGQVFNKEVYARLQTRNSILIFCFMYLSPVSYLSKNLNNTQKNVLYFRYDM